MLLRGAIILLVIVAVHTEKNYTDFVKDIKAKMEDSTGEFYHSAYNRLAYISDTYGPRMWGSPVL